MIDSPEERTDLGHGCPARGQLVRLEVCEIGCPSMQGGVIPVFACAIHQECSPWKWQRNQTMRTCVECVAGGQAKIAEICNGC